LKSGTLLQRRKPLSGSEKPQPLVRVVCNYTSDTIKLLERSKAFDTNLPRENLGYSQNSKDVNNELSAAKYKFRD